MDNTVVLKDLQLCTEMPKLMLLLLLQCYFLLTRIAIKVFITLKHFLLDELWRIILILK